MVRIALGQLNTTVGDLDGNVARMADVDGPRDRPKAPTWSASRSSRSPATRPRTWSCVLSSCEDNLAALDDAREGDRRPGCAVIVGFVDRSEPGLHNAAALLRDGTVAARYTKIKLPNYGVFDEKRVLRARDRRGTMRRRRRQRSASRSARTRGTAARRSTSTRGGPGRREHQRLAVSPRQGARPDATCCAIARRETGAWIVYVNAVGGQDELVFDGGSMVVAPDGHVACRAARFDEDLLVVITLEDGAVRADGAPDLAGRARGGLPRVGARPRRLRAQERLHGRSSSGSRAASTRRWSRRSPRTPSVPRPSARSRCRRRTRAPRASRTRSTSPSRLGVRLDTVPIDDVFDAYGRALADLFAGTAGGVAEENLQARIRGNLLMALSNKFGSMVLATGNKSEYAVGYATLYGDMAGGFAPIKDVPKTLVYELCRVAERRGGRARRAPPIPRA